MQLANAPAQIQLPFAADDATKNTIPVASQIPITPGAASYTDGFPPLTAVDPTAGGIGPSKADMNGILFATSSIDLWLNAGAGFVYDAALSTAIGGYPLGARLVQANGAGYWRSIVDNNTSDPDTGGAGWVPEGGKRLSSVYASNQQTLAVGNSKVLYDTVEFDGGIWNPANQRFQAPWAGVYRVSGLTYLPAPGGQNMECQIWKNGAFVKRGPTYPQVSDGAMGYSFDAMVSLNVGDFIEIFMSIPGTAVLAGLAGSNEANVFAQLEFLGT